MAMERQDNVALLIDADNASPAHLDSALQILAELGAVNIRRAYGNWSKPALKGWSQIAHTHAIDPQQQFDVTKGKNATDMKMTIDAMDLLFLGRVQGFGLMSSDSDFAPLVTRLRQDGVPVYGFGTERAPVSFRNACTRFIDLEGVAKDNGGSASRVIGADVVKLFYDAISASKRDEKGFAALSDVGKRLNSVSSFDARSYGFSRLVDLASAIPELAVERRDGGAVYLRRLR
jgi:hypothetical protein